MTSKPTPAPDPLAVRCPKCNCGHFMVVYTRVSPAGVIRRRRECRHCGHRITTYERRG